MTSNGNGHRSVLNAFAGKHILVTGVTGFLGKVWLAMLLHRVPTVRRVTVVIRVKRKQNAHDRFEEIASSSPAFRTAREELGPRLFDILDDKVAVLAGDCAEPMCGLSDATVARIAPDIDAVVHFAGLTDFEPDPPAGIDTNVRGALNAADLAARCGGRLIHVSTCYVAGMVSGRVREGIQLGISPLGIEYDPAVELAELEAAIAEHESRTPRLKVAMARAEKLGWPNVYTYTKALAEQLLYQRKDVKVTTVRPAIVEGSRSYPFPGWNEGINTSGPLVWLFSTSFRHFPSKERNHFDVIPVDTVARATTLIVGEALQDRAHDIYQLGSSHKNPFLFKRAIELTNLAVRRMHKKNGASGMERWVLRHLDVVPVDQGEKPPLGVTNMRWAAQKARDFLKRLDLHRNLPPSFYERHGVKWDAKVKSVSQQFRNADRQLGRVEEMLRLYKPFIHDHDYVFHTDRIAEATELLPADERELFGFDIETLDWRHYWLDVHVPGLEKWTLPLLKGDKVPNDPPMKRRRKPSRETRADRDRVSP